MQKEVAAQDAVKKALGTLESFLSTRTFLVLHRITLADIVAFCNLYIGYTKVPLPAAIQRKIPYFEKGGGRGGAGYIDLLCMFELRL